MGSKEAETRGGSQSFQLTGDAETSSPEETFTRSIQRTHEDSNKKEVDEHRH